MKATLRDPRNVLASQITPMAGKTEAEYKDVFTLFDRDAEGNIKTTDVGTALRALGRNPSEAELQKLIREIDPEGNGKIDFSDFLAISKLERDRKVDTEEEIQEAFKVFDRDGSGEIQTAELRHVLMNLGEKFTEDEVECLLVEAQLDAKGSVKYEELISLLMSS